MSTAVFPGSFDPITLGHLDIISRSAKLFDRVVVCIMYNSAKTSPMFTPEERVELVKKVIAPFPNVEVETSDGLLAEHVKKYEDAVLVKGLRSASDFEYEFQLNLINKKLCHELDTVFLTSAAEYSFLSSTVVREMARYGADLSSFAPSEIIDDIEKKAQLWRR